MTLYLWNSSAKRISGKSLSILYPRAYKIFNLRFQTCFHGVNLSAIQNCAVKEYFRQPIVDTFDIRICLSKSVRHVVDFLEANETDLHTIGENLPHSNS